MLCFDNDNYSINPRAGEEAPSQNIKGYCREVLTKIKEALLIGDNGCT